MVSNRGHTIGPMFANSLRIHMVFLNTYFDLEVGTESPHELTKITSNLVFLIRHLESGL